MTGRHPSPGAALLAAVTCAALSGCLAPENASLFQPGWERALAEAERHEPDLPDTPRPLPVGGEWLAVKLDDGGPLDLSIEEVTVLALRNNRDLSVQELNPVIVGAFELIERGVFDPEAFADFEYGEQTASEISRGTGEQFSVESEDTIAVAGVRQDLPSGTNVEVSVGQDRDISNRAPEQQRARLGLTITQQLLQGAGPAVNLVRIRQAEIDTRASLYELRGFTEALLAEAEATYWQYALALERIAIFERSLEVARRQRDDVEERIEVGVIAPTEGAVARAEVARREQALIEARADLEAQRLRLLRLIDVPSPERPVIVTSSPSRETTPLTDLDERLRLAESLRPDLAEARLRLERDRLETIVTRNGLLPRLEVFIALGKTGFGDTFSGSFRALDDDTYDLTAGVSFRQLLGNDAAVGRNQAAYASRRQASAAIVNLAQIVRLEVRLAANELELARQQIGASRVTRVLEEDTVRAEIERFEVGASTALLVAQAQRDLLQAQIIEVESIVAYRLALIDLYVAEGSLLECRGYLVGPRPE